MFIIHISTFDWRGGEQKQKKLGMCSMLLTQIPLHAFFKVI